MTEERKNLDSIGETDALVTRTYRDVANERAPDHLNQAVLKEAASTARPRYSRLINWTRPMAWAATVMLCVALVLEVTKVPVPQSVAPSDNAIRFESEAPELDVADDAPAAGRVSAALEAETPASEVLEEAILPATQPGRASRTAAPKKAQIEEMHANEASSERALRTLADGTLAQDEQLATPQPSSTDEFKVKDVQMLLKAEDMARTQIGDKAELNQSVNAAVASDAIGYADIAGTCDEAARATPESWLACIEELVDAGRLDEAHRQRDLLQEAFPEFDAH